MFVFVSCLFYLAFVSKVHLGCVMCQNFIPFKGGIHIPLYMCVYMYVCFMYIYTHTPHFIYPFIYGWTFGLFSTFGYYKDAINITF